MTPSPASLLAGATGPHGRHERPDEGWDKRNRTGHGYDPDATRRGRHAETAEIRTKERT